MIHIVSKLHKSDYSTKIDLSASVTTITITDDSEYKASRSYMVQDKDLEWLTDNDVILMIVTRLLGGKVYTYNALYNTYNISNEAFCTYDKAIQPVDYSKFDNLLDFISNRYKFFSTLSDDDFKYFAKGI